MFDFLLLLISDVHFFYLRWFMSKHMHYIQRCWFGSIIYIRMKIRPISSLHGSWFCLARNRLLIHQKTSDCLILTNRLFELQRLGEIKFYVVLYKAYIPGTWLSKWKLLSVFLIKDQVNQRAPLSLKIFATSIL